MVSDITSSTYELLRIHNIKRHAKEREVWGTAWGKREVTSKFKSWLYQPALSGFEAGRVQGTFPTWQFVHCYINCSREHSPSSPRFYDHFLYKAQASDFLCWRRFNPASSIVLTQNSRHGRVDRNAFRGRRCHFRIAPDLTLGCNYFQLRRNGRCSPQTGN
jgi:hypothetical protein